MREIKVITWNAKISDSNGSKDIEESIITILNALLRMQNPENIPKGLDKFRFYRRITKALDEGKETRMLKLEESDYSFFRKLIETDMPSVWGMNENISNAIDKYLNAKDVKQ